jgi:hypothetical protein
MADTVDYVLNYGFFDELQSRLALLETNLTTLYRTACTDLEHVCASQLLCLSLSFDSSLMLLVSLFGDFKKQCRNDSLMPSSESPRASSPLSVAASSSSSSLVSLMISSMPTQLSSLPSFAAAFSSSASSLCLPSHFIVSSLVSGGIPVEEVWTISVLSSEPVTHLANKNKTKNKTKKTKTKQKKPKRKKEKRRALSTLTFFSSTISYVVFFPEIGTAYSCENSSSFWFLLL